MARLIAAYMCTASGLALLVREPSGVGQAKYGSRFSSERIFFISSLLPRGNLIGEKNERKVKLNKRAWAAGRRRPPPPGLGRAGKGKRSPQHPRAPAYRPQPMVVHPLDLCNGLSTLACLDLQRPRALPLYCSRPMEPSSDHTASTRPSRTAYACRWRSIVASE